MIILGGQQSDPAIDTRVSILPQTPLPPRLPHNIEQSFMSYTGGPCWLSVLFIFLTFQPILFFHLFLLIGG